MSSIKLIPILLLLSTAKLHAGDVIDRFPKSHRTIRLLHSTMRRYLSVFRDSTIRKDFNNGCTQFLEERHDNAPKVFLFCASSVVSSEENRVVDTLRIIVDDELVQVFSLMQFGPNIRPTPLEDIMDLNFHLTGVKGNYSALGLTALSFNFEETEGFEKSLLTFEPVNFYLETFFIKDPMMERIRYDVRCSFCGGISWLEIQEFKREGLPDLVLYHNSNEPRDITPRLFESQFDSLYYRPLNQLGFAIQSTLVFQGGFPEIRF